tara:strand:- start:1145 stop:1738 length:594 start_codon:yes stop_codon:yes gene_type:complete
MKTDFVLKTIPIKDKDYVPVDERLKAFHKYYDGHIETEVLERDTCVDQLSGKQADRYVVVARVYPYSFDMEADEHTRSRFYSGSASEISTQGFINKTSALENCETSAIGRALGIMGIGLDNGVASYQEVKQAVKSKEQAMARSTDYTRVDKKVNKALELKLISKAKHISYKKLRSEGMLLVDLVEMEKRIDKMLEGK